MRFITTVADLRDALRTVRRAMVTNPSLVAYSGVFVRATTDRVYLTGSDGETTITARLEGNALAPGQVLIAPAAIGDFLDTFAAKDQLDVTLDDAGDVTVKVGERPPYVFRSLHATFPSPSTSATGLEAADWSNLAAAVGAVKHASSGVVQFVSTDSNLILNTTDTYRLAQVRLTGAGFGPRDGVALLSAVEELARHNLTHVGVDSKGAVLRARSDRLFVSSRLVAGVDGTGREQPFPAVDSVLNQTPPNRVTFERTEMVKVLSRLGALANLTPVRVAVAGNELTCAVSNVEVGAGAETLKLDGPALDEFVCSVQLRYLADAVAAHADGTVELFYSTPLAPLHLRSSSSGGSLTVTTVVMPVRAGA